jgi:hypothetical protein
MKSIFIANTNTSSADQHATNVIYVVKVCLFTIIALLIFVLKGNCADRAHVTAKNAVYVQSPKQETQFTSFK